MELKPLRYSADPLAEFSDDPLSLEPVREAVVLKRDEWWLKFQYHLYDWEDPEFKKLNRGKFAYLPIKLTQGYFMMVSPSRYEEMTNFPDGATKTWCAHVRCPNRDGEITGVYAVRRGHKLRGEATSILAHRELLRILDQPSLEGDHMNGWGLDNRSLPRTRVNLDAVKHGPNISNTARSSQFGLPPGVERTGKPGNYRYNGKVCMRLSRKKVVTIRSRKWKTAEPAAAWYRNYLKRTHKRSAWAHNPKSVNFPIFPPVKPEYRVLIVEHFIPLPTGVVVDDIGATF